MLDPQAQALLQLMQEKGAPPVHTLTPVQARIAYQERRTYTQPSAPPLKRVENTTFNQGGINIPVRLYYPDQHQAAESLPALVYLHGGGWTIGDLDTHDVVCRTLCCDAQCVVMSVDYRLAPEHPFPAAYDDAVAAWLWLHAQAEQRGVDPQRIAIGGDSAGGNLAAAACLGLRALAKKPAMQLLIYPTTHMQPTTPSYQTNGKGYMLTQESMAWYAGNYLSKPEDALDWRASPLVATSLQDLPAAFTLTAGFDPLRDEGRYYADALSQAGVSSQYVCFERQIHGFITMGRVLQEAHTALALCAVVLKSHFTTANP